MSDCIKHDSHPCLSPESIHKVIDNIADEKEKADFLFHFIFHGKCDNCTGHIIDGITKSRKRIYDTLKTTPLNDQQEIIDSNEEKMRKLCAQIGVKYPRPIY